MDADGKVARRGRTIVDVDRLRLDHRPLRRAPALPAAQGDRMGHLCEDCCACAHGAPAERLGRADEEVRCSEGAHPAQHAAGLPRIREAGVEPVRGTPVDAHQRLCVAAAWLDGRHGLHVRPREDGTGDGFRALRLLWPADR
eukprot:5871383-Prymnesium_polylepis.1